MSDLELVKKNGLALEYVHTQTPEICLAAVRKTGLALKYVKDQTPEICMEAVRNYGRSLWYVESQTPEICMIAVSQNGLALQYVKDQTPEICMEAVKNYGRSLSYVETKYKTLEMCMEAVRQYGFNLRYVPYSLRTVEICIEAIKDDPKCSIDFYNMGHNIDVFIALIRSFVNYYKEMGEDNKCEDLIQNFLPKYDIEGVDGAFVVKYVGLFSKERLAVDDIVKNSISLIQFLHDINVSDFFKILDHIIDNNIELTEYQGEQLKRLEKCVN